MLRDDGKYPPGGTNTHLCPESIDAVLSCHGLVAAQLYEICLGREIAASLFQVGIASTDLLKSVHLITQSSVYCHKRYGAQTGFLALIPLREAALPLFQTDSFDALDFDLGLVTRPGEPVACIYLWGFAALHKEGARRVIAAIAHLQERAFPDLPFYARVASAKGGGILAAKLGYGPVPGLRETTLRYAPPASARGVAL